MSRCVPPPSPQPLLNLAYEIVSAFYWLAATVERDEWQECFRAADSNLGVIDGFLYRTLGLPVSGESDEIVHGHRLMRTEMRRQIQEIDILTADPPDVVRKIRNGATGISVLDTEWF